MPDALPLIEACEYFVVHAPRQTGKTTTLAALARRLTAEGTHVAVHFSCEAGEATGDDYVAAQQAVLDAIRRETERLELPPELAPPDEWPDASSAQLLGAALTAWARRCPRPLVLIFDEIDALRGESLRSVLRQLRDGFRARPAAFPASVVLCGLRDVRDYKVASGGDPTRLGTASPFNIKVESVRLGDFTDADVRALYAQHTAETGQEFTEPALARAWEYSRGQPWLVNAIAREVIQKIGVAPAEPITAEHIDQAKERLIRARATHLDSLAAPLAEPRVRRVLQPLIAGTLPEADEAFDDDVSYLRDLGLLGPDRPVAIANPIYREVVLRVLGSRVEEVILSDPRSFVLSDGRLEFRRLLEEFACFWRQHGEMLTSTSFYHEAAHQIVIMAFLHRIVNGGGYIEREIGVGRGRIDLLVRWPYTDGDGKRVWQREAMELKAWSPERPDPLPEGLRQLDDYLARLDLDRGTLVVFDQRRETKPIAERTDFHVERTPSGREVTLLRA